MGKNAEIVRAALEAWNRREMETVARYLHSDFEWVEHEQSPVHTAPRTGTSAVERITGDLEEGLVDYRAEVLEVVEVDEERCVAVLRETGRGATSGASFSTEFGYVIVLRDGKASRIEVHRDPRDAFAAVGRPSRRAAGSAP